MKDNKIFLKDSKVFLGVALLQLAFLSSGWAAQWDIDVDHSDITFTIKHLVVTNVSGQLPDFKGHLNLDEKDVTKTTAEVVIQSKSISTHNAKRDTHLKSPDFFDTKKYPTITFKSKKAEGDSLGKFRLTGNLTLHGVTKEVTFEAQSPETTIKDPWGNTVRGFVADAEINRQDFGISFSKTMDGGGALVGDAVKIHIELSLTIPSAKRPKS